MISRTDTYNVRASRTEVIHDARGASDYTQSSVSDHVTACGFREISGYRGPRQPDSVNACDHTVVQFVPRRVSTHWQSWIPSRSMNMTSYLAGTFNVSGDLGISPSTYDGIIQDLVGEIPTDVLLPNFIIELPEALTLYKSLIDTVSNLAKRVKIGKSLSDGGLSYSFGMKPLAGDIAKLVGLTRRVSKRIRYLSRLSADDYTSFRRKVPIDISPTVGFTWDWWSGHYGVKYGTTSLESENIAVAEVFARIIRTRQVNPATENKLGLLDATGMSQLGSVIWEAIPFSFVADWFFPAGRALDFLNTQAFEGACAYSQCGYQSHIHSTVKVRGIPNPSSNEWNKYADETPVLGAGTVKYYMRRAGLPATSSGYHFGASQRVLAGMLALQKLG